MQEQIDKAVREVGRVLLGREEQIRLSLCCLLDNLQRLVAYTRNAAEFAYGLSPRGALALLHCARTWALMSGRPPPGSHQ